MPNEDPFAGLDSVGTLPPPDPKPPTPQDQTAEASPFAGLDAAGTPTENDPKVDQQILLNRGLTDAIEPERAARVYKQSQTIPQLPPDYINRNLDEIESWTAQPGYDAAMGRAYLQNSPAVAKFIADDPYAARLVAPDLKDTAAWWNLEGAAPAVFNGFQLGWNQGSLALARNDQRLGGDGPDLNKRIMDLETMAAKTPDGAGWLHVLRGLGSVFGGMVPATEGGIAAGAPAAAAGAVAGAAAGAPEGGVGAVPGAIMGGLAFGRAGFTAGFAATLFQATAGDAYHSLSEHVDENGAPLGEWTKQSAATVIALGNTALMMVGLGRAASFAPKALGRSLSNPAIQAALGRFNNAATRFAVGTGQSVLEQGALGGAMGAVNNFTERMADYVGNLNGGNFKHDDSTLATTFAGAVDGAADMMEAMAIPSLLGGFAHMRAKPPELPAPPRVAAAAQTASGLNAIGKQAADSKMSGRSPQAVGALVENMASQNGSPQAGIPLEAFNAHFSSDGRDPAAEAARITGDPTAHQRATAEGTDILVTPKQLGTEVLATKDYEALAPHVRMTPGVSTLGEMDPEAAKAAAGKPVEPAAGPAAGDGATEPPKPPEPAAAAPETPEKGPYVHANPGMEPDARAFWDAVTKAREGRTDGRIVRSEVDEAAGKTVDADPDAVEQRMIQQRSNGKGPGSAEERAQEAVLVNRRLDEAYALPEGPEREASMRKTEGLASLFRQGGMIAAQTLGQVRDRVETPAERMATARLRVAEKADPGKSDQLRAAEQELFEAERARTEGERASRAAEAPEPKAAAPEVDAAKKAPEPREKNSSSTKATNKPVKPTAAARRKELKASRAALFDQLKKLAEPAPPAPPSGRVGPRSGSVPAIDLGLPDPKNVPAMLKVAGQLAKNYVEDGSLAFSDFVRDMLKAVPAMRTMADVHAKLDEVWDAAKGVRDTTAAAIAAFDEHGRAMLRYERTARLYQALTEKFNADAKAIAGMSPTDAQAFLDNEGKKTDLDIPPEIKARLEDLKSDMTEARKRWQTAKAAVEAARAPVDGAPTKEEDEATELQAKIERAEASIKRAQARASLSDQERLEEILSNRSARNAERAFMPATLRDLHDTLDDLRDEQRRTDARVAPKKSKDVGPDQDKYSRDKEFEAEETARRDKEKLDKRIDDVKKRINAEVANLWTDPKTRAIELEKIRQAGAAKRKADREALPPELRIALDALDGLRKARQVTDRSAVKGAKTSADLAQEALDRLSETAKDLREQLAKSDPERKAELDKAKGELEAKKAAEPGEVRRMRLAVKELKKMSDERDKALTPKPEPSPVERAARDLRREVVRGESAAKREKALNDQLAAMTPEERRAHLEELANAPDAEVPEDIAEVRERSGKTIKDLKEQRKRLAEEGMSEADHEAAIIRGIQRTHANTLKALQAKRAKYLSMTDLERKQLALGKLPTVQGLMTRLAQEDLSPLRRQIRDLEVPPDVAEMKKRIVAEANARNLVGKLQAQLGKQAAARKAKLLHDGFDIDNPDAAWLKDPHQWKQFKQALSKTDGTWGQKFKEGILSNLHASVVLGPVKAVSDMISVHTEMAARSFQAMAQGSGGTRAAAQAWGSMYQHGMPAARQAFMDSFHNGLTMADTTPWGDMHSRYGYISGKKGDIARFSFRVVSAIDQASKAMAAYGVVGMEAHATGLHLKGEDLKAHLESEIADHDSESWQRARLFAARATFTEDNWLASKVRGTFDRTDGNATGDNIARATGAILFPFARVPLNILGRGLSYAVPGASLLYHAWDECQRPVTGTPEEMKTQQARLDDRRKNDLVKTALSSLVYAGMVESGITQWKDSKGRPILTGWADKEHPTEFYGFNYGRLGPSMQALGMMVDAVNAFHHAITLGSAGTATLTAIRNHVASDSFLRTVSSIGNAFDEHSAGGGGLAFLVAIMSTMTPSVAREALKNANPNEVTHTGESIPRRGLDALTGLGGQPRVTPFGHVVSKGSSGNAVADFVFRETNPAKTGDTYDLSPAGMALSTWNRDHPSEAISTTMPHQDVRVDGVEKHIPTPSYQAALRDGGRKAGAYVQAYAAAAGIRVTAPTPALREVMDHALRVYRDTAVRAKADPTVVERSLEDAQNAGEYDAAHEIGNWDRGHAKKDD